MNKTLPIVALFVIIFILFSLYYFFRSYEKKIVSKVSIDFELPLLDSIAGKYDISSNPEIEKIIIAGFFSDWDPENENYLMNYIADKNKWEIELILPPGNHQYKFVIYLKGREKPVWSQDNDSYQEISNGLGGYNSLVYIRSFKKIMNIILVLAYFILIFTLILSLYTLLSKMKVNLKLMIISIIVFVVIINVVFSVMYFLHSKSTYIMISKSIISVLNDDFDKYLTENFEISSDKTRLDIYNVFNYFLWYRLDRMGIRNLQDRFKYSSIIFFDKDFNMISFDYRYFCNQKRKMRISREEMKSILEKYFKLQKIKFSESNISSVNYRFPKFQSLYIDRNYFEYKRNFRTGIKELIPIVNSYAYPIVVNNEIHGYYGIVFAEKITKLIDNYFSVNILCLVLIIFLLYLAYFLKGNQEENVEDKINVFVNKYNITSREKDIIILMLGGFSNKEIAYDLDISKRTVDNHIYNIFHKTDAKNRVELINLVKK